MTRQDGIDNRGKDARFLSMTRSSVVITAGAHVFRISKWWLLGTTVLALMGGLAGLSLLKVWTATPAGFVPVVRVSWVDMLQARTLEKSAREYMAAGRWREAALGWRGAVANNPADVRLLRGWVEAAVTGDKKLMEEGGVPLGQAVWLLRLGGTNALDLDLVVRLLGRLEAREDVIAMGLPKVGQLGVGGAAHVLRAMFDLGDVGGFDRLWKEREKDFSGDPELMLYREAWKAHWGPPSTLREGRDRLQAAQADPRMRTLALRLACRVAAGREDMDEHGRLLGLLAADLMAGVQDHVKHWQLLASHGRLEEAKRLARDSNLTPETVPDVHQLMEAFIMLGMPERALVVVERRPRWIRPDTRLLLLHARTLEVLGKWEDMRLLALSLRLDPGMALPMEGCSYALEAIALEKLGRVDGARAAAGKAGSAPGGDPAMVLPVATSLAGAGYPTQALAMLKAVEAAMNGTVSYWNLRLLVASRAGDIDEIVRASGRVFELLPEDMAASNNHAASLLVARKNPGEAVRLTFRNLAKAPGDPNYLINHAMALTMNDRPEESAKILSRIPLESLSPVQAANYHLAWFDVSLTRRDWDGARTRAGLIDQDKLQPLEKARLEKELKELPAR